MYTLYFPGIILSLLLLCGSPQLQGQDKELNLHGRIIVYTAAQEGEPLFKAVNALRRDIEKTGAGIVVIKNPAAMDTSGIVIMTLTGNETTRGPSGWEAHRVYLDRIKGRQQVILRGADMRGTIYAIYTFSEKVLGVPPLWYYCGWEPAKIEALKVPLSLDISIPSPEVKYRAWFPNDTDLFSPWRKQSPVNNEIWLETALRLKLNTIEWYEDGANLTEKYAVSPTSLLIHRYGLVNTTHHHSPLNASFQGWEHYWTKIRDTIVPELSLANEQKIEEFWSYHIESVKRAGLDMLWVIGFRGAGDHPFWFTFKDAPSSMEERGRIISHMMQKQRDLVIRITGDTNAQFRTIFYDELSDLLAKGYIQPPADSHLIWTFVAARRDHFPNTDVRQLADRSNKNLGYYFNYQFTSTGSHLAPGEGPWKMEQNYRYVATKSSKPLLFSVVNAGNIREFTTELSANAAMMWNFRNYQSDSFLRQYSILYFGKEKANDIAQLYRQYYAAYWQQKKPDLIMIDRQYIFQDLRYRRAIAEFAKAIETHTYNRMPLTDHDNEQFPGRTYRIEPAGNNSDNTIDALLKGTSQSSQAFLKTAEACSQIGSELKGYRQTYLHDNLQAPAYFMYDLNNTLTALVQAWQHPGRERPFLAEALRSLTRARATLFDTQHGPFSNWYGSDRIFNIQQLITSIEKLNNIAKPVKKAR